MSRNLFLLLSFLICISVTYQELTKLKQVPPRSFPYVVSLESHEWCHGVLITRNYVLTNARCVVGSADINIFLGWYTYPEYQKPLNAEDIQISTSNSVTPHPDYKVIQQYWTYHNDIALVKLSKPISITSGVTPAKLADPTAFKDIDLAGLYGTVFGWWPVGNLSAVTVQIRPHNYFHIFGRNYFQDRQFCIQWPVGERLCSHHSLPMEIDGKFIGLEQDDPQNDIECMLYEYKFINILYYYDWIMKNSDLEQYINEQKYGNQKRFSEDLKSAIETTISIFETSDTYRETKKKCKIDIELACPENKESF